MQELRSTKSAKFRETPIGQTRSQAPHPVQEARRWSIPTRLIPLKRPQNPPRGHSTRQKILPETITIATSITSVKATWNRSSPSTTPAPDSQRERGKTDGAAVVSQ
jgi:hypothetical protein